MNVDQIGGQNRVTGTKTYQAVGIDGTVDA